VDEEAKKKELGYWNNDEFGEDGKVDECWF